MTTDLMTDLRTALEYLIDVHHGDVARDAAELPHLQQAAYWKAITALRRANQELGQVQRDNPLVRARVEQVKLEQRLPVKETLQGERKTVGERIVAGVAVLCQTETMGEDDRAKRRKVFMTLVDRFALLAAQVAAPLPTTFACVCRKCRKVLLPDESGSYACCAVMWQHHRSLNQQGLPPGFWERYAPGDRYTKPMDDMLDGRGRPDIGVSA